MTTNITPAARTAPVRALLFTFLGLPLLSLLAFFWLEIPDSHIWQLGLSLLTGAFVAAAFLWLASGAVRSLRKTTFPCQHWLGAVLLAVWMAIVRMLTNVAGHINVHALERAGYWNSKLSVGMRVTFTSDRLFAWQHDFVFFLVWIVIPALILPFVIETLSRGLGLSAWRVALLTLSRWQHWLAVIVCGVAVYWLTDKLTGWRPSHSVHGEIISLALRLFACYTADFLLITLLLAIDSRLLAREHARRYPAAEPSTNIP